MKTQIKHFAMAAGLVLAALSVGIYIGQDEVYAAATKYSAILIEPTSDSADDPSFRVEDTSGTAVFSISAAGVVTVGGSFGSSTFNPGVTLGTTTVTGTITSPFTATVGTDTFLGMITAAASATDILLRIGDADDSTEHTFFGDGAYTADGLITGTGGVTSTGTLTAAGVVALGDGGDNFSVSSDGIDISTAGAISNATTIAGTGISTTTAAVSLGDGTSTFAVASTGLDVSTAGAISGATTIACSSTITSTSATNIGWTWNDTADNTACDTECINSAAVMGWDVGGSVPVGPASATADLCLCAGAV